MKRVKPFSCSFPVSFVSRLSFSLARRADLLSKEALSREWPEPARTVSASPLVAFNPADSIFRAESSSLEGGRFVLGSFALGGLSYTVCELLRRQRIRVSALLYDAVRGGFSP
jgi:hypothetical protein